jgi:ABC-type sugar transport system substrate-binding protein
MFKQFFIKGACTMMLKSLSLIALAVASVVAAGPSLAQQPIRIGASIAVTPDLLVVNYIPAEVIAITRQMKELDVNVKMRPALRGY